MHKKHAKKLLYWRSIWQFSVVAVVDMTSSSSWKLLVSNDSWTSTNEPPTFFHPDWQIGNCSFFTVGLNKGLVLSVAHAIVFLANWISMQKVRKDKLFCKPSEQLSWGKINYKQSLSIVQTVIIVWHSLSQSLLTQHSVGVFLPVLSDASVLPFSSQVV